MSKKSFTTLTLAVRVVQPPKLTQVELVNWIKGVLAQPGPLSSFAPSTQVKIIGKEVTYL